MKLLHVDGDEEQLLAALLFEAAGVSEERTREEVARLSADDRAALLADLVGERANRRHRPGRGFEALRYRFEIVSDYGAFRDLQRHRMLTVQWQGLTPDLGAGMPDEVVEAGAGDLYARALERSEEEYERLAAAGLRDAAPYALCLGFRIRYVLDLNAREAMHTIELRSGREGHPSYRAVAHEMHAQIAEHHPAVAAAMTHVDTSTEPRLERILSEMRTERRALARAKCRWSAARTASSSSSTRSRASSRTTASSEGDAILRLEGGRADRVDGRPGGAARRARRGGRGGAGAQRPHRPGDPRARPARDAGDREADVRARRPRGGGRRDPRHRPRHRRARRLRDRRVRGPVGDRPARARLPRRRARGRRVYTNSAQEHERGIARMTGAGVERNHCKGLVFEWLHTVDRALEDFPKAKALGTPPWRL